MEDHCQMLNMTMQVSISYNENFLSCIVLLVLCGFFNNQENDRRRRRTMAPRSKLFLYLTFISHKQTFRVVFGLKRLNVLVQSLSFARPVPIAADIAIGVSDIH
jgi:hypothetical protein